ncbi:trehalose-phosphatase [Phenylobacterium sp.]|uniref:trehalose-phosphatase n=1 Tax=Phenylobacterium sp. TaxID=1871053 RepID=UPI00271ADDBB|nr:trehalose-phosphatase [Phenylobacterium sp.]MDO8377649.1 trehalose-phosphatase [Phenylobacterium sp.]
MAIAELDIRPDAPPAPLALANTALFLDLDGTLAPIAARPQDVTPDPRRTSILEALLGALDGRLAVVSGRTLADVDRILEGRVRAVAAVHGLVRRDADGEIARTTPHPALPQALADLRRFADSRPGLLVEDKQVSATLHYRGAPDQATAARAEASRIAAATGLALQPGDMVWELRTPGATKGDSVVAFLTQSPFAGATPVFVGDDLTDEDGFTAARALGGFGVLVGPARATAARLRLEDVDAALAWLEAAR